MLRFKAFSAPDVPAVEQQINAWLKQAAPDVKLMQQSIASTGAVIVGFVYDEGFMASEQRLTAEASAIVEEALQKEPILEPIQVDQEQV